MWLTFSDYIWDDQLDNIYTKNESNVIKTDDIQDPIKWWTQSAVEWLNWIANANMDTNEEKQESFTIYIANWVNYFLWLLWMITIIFIIKDWIVLISQAHDENKKKEAFTNLKNYIIAIIMIWVAYLIVNLIFHFVNTNT